MPRMSWEAVGVLVALALGILNLWLHVRSTVTSVGVRISAWTEMSVTVEVRNRSFHPVQVVAVRYTFPSAEGEPWDPSAGMRPSVPETINARGRVNFTINSALSGDHGHVAKLPNILRKHGVTFIVELSDGQRFQSPSRQLVEAGRLMATK